MEKELKSKMPTYVEVHSYEIEHEGDMERATDAIQQAGGHVDHEDPNFEAETCDFIVLLNEGIDKETFFKELKELDGCCQ